MNFSDRPGDWLGYAPGESPIRPGGGPNSPKKKLMTWRTAQDAQLSKERQQPGDTVDIEKPTPSPLPAPVELESSEGSVEEIIDDGVELVVDEDGPVFEVVEYTDEDDEDGSEYEEEVLEDSDESSHRSDGGRGGGGASDRTDDDSMFDPLPPPIQIPNALKPAHMRQPETKPAFAAARQDDSSSYDDSTDSDDEDKKKTNRISPLRPKKLRGHSNDGLQVLSDHDRPGKSPESLTKKPEKVQEEIKEAPRVVASPVRPAIVRGHSCEDDVRAMNEAVKVCRGGKRPDKDEIKEAPRVVPSSVRPAIVRGHSCEDDIQAMNEAVKASRGGKRPEAQDNDKNEVASSPVSPLRPGTLRGHSFDNDTQDTSTVARGGKRPDSSRGTAIGHRDQPTTPTQTTKPSYQSLRNETPTSPKTPSRATAAPAAPTTPKTPGRRGEDTAPPTPCYTRVDDDGVEHKEYTWEKPEWATKSKLRSTAKGDKLKSGSDIARPIGGIKPVVP